VVEAEATSLDTANPFRIPMLSLSMLFDLLAPELALLLSKPSNENASTGTFVSTVGPQTTRSLLAPRDPHEA